LRLKDQRIYKVEDIEFKVIYSRRRSIGISVLPDSSVIVRVPLFTSLKTINRIVNDKYSWVLRHRDNYKHLNHSSLKKTYKSGEIHLFKGKEHILRIVKSGKPYILFSEDFIEIGTDKTDDQESIRRLLYKGYKTEAISHFPVSVNKVLSDHESQMFNPAGLVIRTMKRRWGSCSNKGIITLSTELIKLDNLYIEYVITHELCHLKQHNHGPEFYKLLSELFPDWKSVRKGLRKYIQ
jgi:predicted metal-dependent hydrolase